MISKTTSQIKVSVFTEYDIKNSFPSNNKFVFKYHISILNLGKFPIKILKRNWLIYDTGFGFSEVSGNGVIGLTPDIDPGEQFTYFSNVILNSGVGFMSGKYSVENLDDKEILDIEIPKFNLVSSILAN